MPKDVGLRDVLYNADLGENTALLWKAKGDNKLLEKKTHGPMIFPQVPEGRC